MPSIKLVVQYALGALAATLINLMTQWISFHLYRGVGELIIGILSGTAMGLVSKFLFDKFWIFDNRSLGLSENLHKFGYYTLTGVFTTVIFWGTEAAFALIGEHRFMRYVGAAIGLSIGYIVKYHLDFRFVFRAKS
jgi:putative flippase GtrA